MYKIKRVKTFEKLDISYDWNVKNVKSRYSLVHIPAIRFTFMIYLACFSFQAGGKCREVTCQNGGTCLPLLLSTKHDNPKEFSCDCKLGFRGKFCEEGILLKKNIIFLKFCFWFVAFSIFPNGVAYLHFCT